MKKQEWVQPKKEEDQVGWLDGKGEKVADKNISNIIKGYKDRK